MRLLDRTRNYYANARVIARRGQIGLEKQCCHNYYSGVVKEIEQAKSNFKHFYDYLKYHKYESILSDIQEETGKSYRTACRVLHLEALQCAQLIEAYEQKHYEELREGLCIKTIYSTSL